MYTSIWLYLLSKKILFSLIQFCHCTLKSKKSGILNFVIQPCKRMREGIVFSDACQSVILFIRLGSVHWTSPSSDPPHHLAV